MADVSPEKPEPTADYDKGRELIDGLKAHIGDVIVDHMNDHKPARNHLDEIVSLGSMAQAAQYGKHGTQANLHRLA